VLAFSRFKRISLAQFAEDCAPPTVSGIDGSFKLSNIAVRNAFRNCSLTVIVASAEGPELAVRRSRLAFDSWAKQLAQRIMAMTMLMDRDWIFMIYSCRADSSLKGDE
jgi:hypothetical protein